MLDLMPLFIPGTITFDKTNFLPDIGKKYYHRAGNRGAVREVLAVDANTKRIMYKTLYAPKGTPSGGCCRLGRFRKWTDGEFIGADYRVLDGAIIRPTFLVLNTKSEPIFRCSFERARFYVNKEYAIKVDDNHIQLKDDYTETRMLELYKGKFSGYFLAVKNDKCVVCGRPDFLSRHHVVPKRQIAKLPRNVKDRLSNVLFICFPCHKKYEDQQLVSDSLDPYVWKDHFVAIMKPLHLHPDWDIISIKE